MTSHIALLGSILFSLVAQTPPTGQKPLQLLVFGDWGRGNQEQVAVAQAMANYLRAHKITLDAVLSSGDNFLVQLPGGIKDPQWAALFEEMYDPKILNAPFYMALGNHDYESGKADIELAYAKENPQSRFKLPAKWYHVNLPESKPLARLLVLDANFSKLTKEEAAQQAQWLEQELSAPHQSAWTVVMGHQPLFSAGRHGDSPELQQAWRTPFNKYKVDFYVCGHDHDLQHLQVPDWWPTFIVSGSGGGANYEVRRDDRMKFGTKAGGFVLFALTPQEAAVTFVNDQGEVLYRFNRRKDGKIETLPSATAPASQPAAGNTPP